MPTHLPDRHAPRNDSRTIATSALWNMIGRLGPILIAVATTPLLISHLGLSRWGVFTIALNLIGIFGIFDFGVGRAMTRTIAVRLAEGEPERAVGVVFTGMLALTLFGLTGGLVAAALVQRWVHHGLGIPAELQTEVADALYVLCLSAPLVLLNGAMWGVIAAWQRFRIANLVGTPILAMYYVGPLLMLLWSNSLVAVMAVLVLCRVAITIAYWLICLRVMPGLRHPRLDVAALRPLLRMGGWMTVSNVIWPLLSYIDRFMVASILSAAATAWYATPGDLLARFFIIPIAVMNTTFPAIAASFRLQPDHAANLFRRSLLAIAALILPASLIVTGLAEPLLRLWLGAAFAMQAAGPMRLLGLAILISCCTTAVMGLLDGIGRPHVNAAVSLVELVIYLPVLVILLRSHGIEGAAMAAMLRMYGDFLARLVLAHRLYPPVRTAIHRALPALLVACLVPILPMLPTELPTRLAMMAVGMALFLMVAWVFSLSRTEREFAIARLPRLASGLQ
jgi:O-antigen/teichoic acid export membrane protein